MNHVKLPVTITPSRTELGARCHRRHFLSDILSKARYSSASLEFGTVVHTGIAAFWLKKDWSTALEMEWQKRFEVANAPDSDKVSLALAKGMLEYYVEHAKLAGPFEDISGWKLVDVEQRFEIPLKEHKLSFQMDRVVYNAEQNWLVIVDSKTAARLDARWERQWEMSLQMKLYKAGAAQVFATGGKVDVVIEGVLKDIPSSVRYYACPDWSDLQLAEAAFNAYTIAGMDAEVILAGCDTVHNVMTPGKSELVYNLAKIEELALRMTPTNPADCYSYGVECPFKRICVADIPERIGILRGEFWDKPDSEDY